jgi:hypothetical protein
VKGAAKVARLTPWRGWLSDRSADILGRRRAYRNRHAVEDLGWDPGDFEARLADTARYYVAKYGPPSVRESVRALLPDPPVEAAAR